MLHQRLFGLHGAWDIKEHFARASLSSWAFVRPAARMLPFPCLHFYVLSQQPNQTQLLALLLHIQKRLGLPPPSLKTLLSNTSWQLTQGLCVARAKLLLMALATQCCRVLRCRRQGFGRAVISKKTHLFFLFVFKGSNASRACSIALPALSEHLKAQRLKPNTATFYLHSLRRKLIFGKAIGYPQSVCQHLPLKCFLCWA